MTSTFYGVLGVGPDADADAIREGYRERVTDVHPDVNDDPDADVQFQRVTTARDVLLDAAERARYDRLGHVSYVRHHVDCSAWTDRKRDGSTSNTDRPRGTAGNSRRESVVDETTTRADRERTGWAAGEARGAAGEAREAAGEASDGAAGATSAMGNQRTAAGSGPEANSAASGDASSATARTGGSGNWRSESNRRKRRRDAAETEHVAGSYAASSFWGAQSVGRHRGPATTASPSLARRLLAGLRALGPWVFVHVAFLTVAVGTCLYVYSVVLADPAASIPLLLVLLGEVALAVVLSSVHVLSRLSL